MSWKLLYLYQVPSLLAIYRYIDFPVPGYGTLVPWTGTLVPWYQYLWLGWSVSPFCFVPGTRYQVPGYSMSAGWSWASASRQRCQNWFIAHARWVIPVDQLTVTPTGRQTGTGTRYQVLPVLSTNLFCVYVRVMHTVVEVRCVPGA